MLASAVARSCAAVSVLLLVTLAPAPAAAQTPAAVPDGGTPLSAAAAAVAAELRGLADRVDPAAGKSDAVRSQASADLIARLKTALAGADEREGALAFLGAELPEVSATGALVRSEKPRREAGFGETQQPDDLAGRAKDARRAVVVATLVVGGLLAPVAQAEPALGVRLLRGCANAKEHGQLQPCMMRSLRTGADLERFAGGQFLPAWKAMRPALGPLDALAKVDPGTRLLALAMLGFASRDTLGPEGLAEGWTLLSDELVRPDACLHVLQGLGTRVFTPDAIYDANANFRPGSYEVRSRCPALGQAFDRAYFLPFWRAMGTPQEPALNETEESVARGVALFNALETWSTKFGCEELVDRVVGVAASTDAWDPAPFLEVSCRKPSAEAVAKLKAAEGVLASAKAPGPALRLADWWAKTNGGVSEPVLATLFTTLESWDARGLQRTPEALKALVDEMEKQNPPEDLPKAVVRAWEALPPKSRELYVQQLWSKAQQNPLQSAQESPAVWRVLFLSSATGPWADAFQQALVSSVKGEFDFGWCELIHCGECNAAFGDVLPELGHERWSKLRTSLHALDRRCAQGQSQWLFRLDVRLAQLTRGWLERTMTGQAEAEAVSYALGCDDPARAPLESLLVTAPYGKALAQKWAKSKLPCERISAVRLLRSDAAANKATLQALAKDKDTAVSAMAKAALAAPPKKK